MYTYKRLDNVAVIVGPVYSYSTRYEKTEHGERGIRVTLFRVDINGRGAFHAPTKDLCRDWLIRCGYRPG